MKGSIHFERFESTTYERQDKGFRFQSFVYIVGHLLGIHTIEYDPHHHRWSEFEEWNPFDWRP